MFHRNSMRGIGPDSPGVKSFRYMTYTVCSSIVPPRSAFEMPVRTVSICDQTGNNEIPRDDLFTILEFCGMDLNRPIDKHTIQHMGAPLLGDSQYYVQTAFNSTR